MNALCQPRLSSPRRSAPTCPVRRLNCLGRLALLAATGLLTAAAAPDHPNRVPVAHWPQTVEAHWVADAEVRALLDEPQGLTTAEDAAGACDGVIDGQWGFHTDQSPNPWWQVDLGALHPLDRIVIWNRCQASERAARLQLKLSPDGKDWTTFYQHDGTVFHGFTDQQPLVVPGANQAARFVRVQLPETEFLHLEEVQVFGSAEPGRNLAQGQPADQVSLSQWSRRHHREAAPDWGVLTREVLANTRQLARELAAAKPQVPPVAAGLEALEKRLQTGPPAPNAALYVAARRLQRELALASPLLDFDAVLFTQRVPPSFSHMSDQYYGWWSKPGGGIYLLRDFKTDTPTVECLTEGFPHPGSFLRPTLAYDGTRVLFAWARHYPWLADHANKLNKSTVPEDAFYHLFEMNLDGTGLRQLTRGKYDDFDGRYLPDGRIVFLSTRRGQSIQVGRQSAAETVRAPDLPDCYVRCGGGPERPVAVYTLHTINGDGSDLCAISPFEMFEWTPEIAHDGSILYSRWDYIDRDNMPYMGLWAIHPDGSNARLVYGNYTHAPHCAFEARPIPHSSKIVFTASAHHAQTMGSLVLLDPAVGLEGAAPLTRLTPEVPFPEIESWPRTSYASPWPLSERHYLVAWGAEGARVPGPAGWNRWHAVQRPADGMALYLFDATTGVREPLFASARFTCTDPIPVRSRPKPPVLAPRTEQGPPEGCLLLSDVYQGLPTVPRGAIQSLRLVAVPPKTHPTMDFPNLGITRDDPGKCVLGTVPVAPDGSAYFRVPAGVIFFIQALDEDGVALQTMRSVTHVQPGQTLGCIGCHEHRQQAPAARPLLATTRPPSPIIPGPPGSWALSFDHLVQPVLDRHCTSCHGPESTDPAAATFDLTAPKAYDRLVRFGQPSLHDQVWAAYRRGHSVPGEGIAQRSSLWAMLTTPDGHAGVQLDPESRERLLTWMDTYAQRLGVFSADQQQRLETLRAANAGIFAPRPGLRTAARR